MKYKYNYDISGGVRFLVSIVSKEKKCPNAPIWINRSSIRGAVFFNLKWRLIFIKWIKWRIRAKVFWTKNWKIWNFSEFELKQEIDKMSARTPPGRFSIDFLLSKGNVILSGPKIPGFDGLQAVGIPIMGK